MFFTTGFADSDPGGTPSALFHCDVLNVNNTPDAMGGPALFLHSDVTVDGSNPKWGIGALKGDRLCQNPPTRAWYADVSNNLGTFNFGVDPFTVEAQYRIDVLPANGGNRNCFYAIIFRSVRIVGADTQFIVDNPAEVPVGGWALAVSGPDSGKLLFAYRDNTGAQRNFVSASPFPGVGSYKHVAVIRDSPTSVKVTVDGTVFISATVNASDTFMTSTTFAFGGNDTAPPGFYSTQGYMDEIRVLKGKAAWTSFPFSPLNRPYVGY